MTKLHGTVGTGLVLLMLVGRSTTMRFLTERGLAMLAVLTLTIGLGNQAEAGLSTLQTTQ